MTRFSDSQIEEMLRKAFHRVKEVSSYAPSYKPAYNARVLEDKKIVYEISLPGYSKSDIEVRHSEDRLTISSNKSKTDPGTRLWQGFYVQPFKISFTTTGYRVSNATFKDGVLEILMDLEENSPGDLVDIA